MSGWGTFRFDSQPDEAYSRAVDVGGKSSQDATAGVHSAARRPRRPPSPTEQTRRKAQMKALGDKVAANWRKTLRTLGEA